MPRRTRRPNLANAPEGAKTTFSVHYSAEHLAVLQRLADDTGISEREWFRALLAALCDAYESRGSITLPLAVVPRDEAEKAGLLRNPSQSPLSPEAQSRTSFDGLDADWLLNWHKARLTSRS